MGSMIGWIITLEFASSTRSMLRINVRDRTSGQLLASGVIQSFTEMSEFLAALSTRLLQTGACTGSSNAGQTSNAKYLKPAYESSTTGVTTSSVSTTKRR